MIFRTFFLLFTASVRTRPLGPPAVPGVLYRFSVLDTLSKFIGYPGLSYGALISVNHHHRWAGITKHQPPGSGLVVFTQIAGRSASLAWGRPIESQVLWGVNENREMSDAHFFRFIENVAPWLCLSPSTFS